MEGDWYQSLTFWLSNSVKLLCREKFVPVYVHLCLREQKKHVKKSRIRETPTVSTDADSRTDTILERMREKKIPHMRDTESLNQRR